MEPAGRPPGRLRGDWRGRDGVRARRPRGGPDGANEGHHLEPGPLRRVRPGRRLLLFPTRITDGALPGVGVCGGGGQRPCAQRAPGAAVSELTDPRYVGTALTLQTSLGFLLTLFTLRLVPLLQATLGWER